MNIQVVEDVGKLFLFLVLQSCKWALWQVKFHCNNIGWWYSLVFGVSTLRYPGRAFLGFKLTPLSLAQHLLWDEVCCRRVDLCIFLWFQASTAQMFVSTFQHVPKTWLCLWALHKPKDRTCVKGKGMKFTFKFSIFRSNISFCLSTIHKVRKLASCTSLWHQSKLALGFPHFCLWGTCTSKPQIKWSFWHLNPTMSGVGCNKT